MGSLAAADGLSHPFEGEIGPSANEVSPGSKLGIEYGASAAPAEDCLAAEER